MKSTVLVLDAHKVSRKVYSKILNQYFEHPTILEAEMGEDGLSLCQHKPISLVILNDRIADMSWLDFLIKLKSNTKAVSVVVVADEGGEELAVSAIKAGATDFLVKGNYAQEHLVRVLRRGFAEAGLQRQIEAEKRRARQAEESLNLFRDLMNQTVDALFVADPFSGVLLDFNDSAWRNLGCNADELKQLTVRDLLVGFEKPSAWNELLDNTRRREFYIHEGGMKRKDGSSYPVEVTLRYVTRDAGQYLVGAARDITKRKEVEEKLRDLSLRDGLTGIHNRRYFDETLEMEWNRQRRHGKELAVLMIDVDFFKLYNDTYGHQAGDKCLQSVARLMMDHFRRAQDFTARYGGEEFVVLLPQTMPEEAGKIADSFRAALEAMEIEHKRSEASAYVTVSLGLAVMIPSEHGSAQDLVEAADRALYRAKGGGRNRLEHA